MTTELVSAPALADGSSVLLGVVPGRTYEIPIPVAAGEAVSVLTSSKDFYDTILVLLSPAGTPILGADDYKLYFAGFEWVAPAGRRVSPSSDVVRIGEHGWVIGVAKLSG